MILQMHQFLDIDTLNEIDDDGLQDIEITVSSDPGQIGSYIGSQFVNVLLEQLLSVLYTEHVQINAYSHEENGLVESVNKEILRFRRAIVNENKTKDTLSDVLP